jgi:hypothetical protein
MIISELTPATARMQFNVHLSPGDGSSNPVIWGTSGGLNQAGTAFSSGHFSGARNATGRATNIRLAGSSAMSAGGVLTLFGVV